MKANRAPKFVLLALCAGLAALTVSCAQKRAIAPAPTPTAAPLPLPAPLPPVPRVSDWRDAPATPGTWRWRMEGSRSVARYGPPSSESALVFSCNREAGAVTLLRPGSGEGQVPMTIQTATISRTLSAAAEPGPPPMIALTLSARDGLLDAMAFSRGRFAVETAGLPTLYVPSWTEVSRVIEDCR
jgi:hypothetical protein